MKIQVFRVVMQWTIDVDCEDEVVACQIAAEMVRKGEALPDSAVDSPIVVARMPMALPESVDVNALVADMSAVASVPAAFLNAPVALRSLAKSLDLALPDDLVDDGGDVLPALIAHLVNAARDAGCLPLLAAKAAKLASTSRRLVEASAGMVTLLADGAKKRFHDLLVTSQAMGLHSDTELQAALRNGSDEAKSGLLGEMIGRAVTREDPRILHVLGARIAELPDDVGQG